MVESVFNLIVFILNTLIWLLGKVLSLIFSLLPNSPFLNLNLDFGINKYLGYLAWLIPIKKIIEIGAFWLSAMAIYYIYSAVMRWIKLID